MKINIYRCVKIRNGQGFDRKEKNEFMLQKYFNPVKSFAVACFGGCSTKFSTGKGFGT